MQKLTNSINDALGDFIEWIEHCEQLDPDIRNIKNMRMRISLLLGCSITALLDENTPISRKNLRHSLVRIQKHFEDKLECDLALRLLDNEDT